jgi:hypothetical protein
MLYVAGVPAQAVSLPVIDPGAGGGPTQTARKAAGDVPQAFVAATVMVPPAGPAAAVMEPVVEVPVQPPGSVQV